MDTIPKIKMIKINKAGLVLILLACGIFFSGCAGMQISALEKITAEDKAKNEQIALASGQRTFDVPKKNLMKAIITAYANKNLTVKNVDKELGFIVAEGGEFVDAAKVKQISMQGRIARLNEASFAGAFIYTPGNYTVLSTVTIFEKGENKNLVE